MHHRRSGFTIVEVLIIIVVLSILLAIVTISYSGWNHRTADNTVKSDVQTATTSLESYKNFKNDYPPNLAGTSFAPSDDVVLILRTDAPQIRTYSNLTPSQNAQLFLNTCNANMPTKSADGSVTYNTSCTFAGNNIHVKGTSSSNVILNGPTINESDVALSCGSGCDAAIAAIKSQFIDQGGSFPLTVPNGQVALPAPTFATYGSATQYCLEGRDANFTDVVYHATNSSPNLTTGPCPENAALHYP